MNKGKFIVIEGLDGSGKTTQLEFIKKWFKDNMPNKTVILTREPGGTDNPIGEQIREILLNNEMNDYTRVLLYAASRYEHSKKIEEWIRNGYIVICDRYLYSSIAYQSSDIISVSNIINVNRYENIAIPDLVLFLRVDFDTYQDRKNKRRQERDLDAIEKKDNMFFKKALRNYDTYLEPVCHLQDVMCHTKIKVAIINSNKNIEEVSSQIKESLNDFFNIKEEF